jgi:tetratricopeptide (TPR) repeat protein
LRVRHRFLAHSAVLFVLLGVTAWAAPRASAQNAWVLEALQQYAAGQYELVTPQLVHLVDLKAFQNDIEKVSGPWLSGKTQPVPPARRAIAAFALEAAASHLSQAEAATKLLEWACKLVRLEPRPGEFEHRWHLAALALFEGAIAPNALESQAAHFAIQFPNDPRIVFARGLAEEQRTAPFMPGTRPTDVQLATTFDRTIAKYQLALADEGTRADAALHIGYTEVRRKHYDAALAALAGVEAHTKDHALVYCARLFTGQALEGLNRTADAEAAYRAALDVAPESHSAPMALIALMFRSGRRADASSLADRVMAAREIGHDPWWDYWPGDFRMANEVILKMREARK